MQRYFLKKIQKKYQKKLQRNKLFFIFAALFK